MDRKKQLIENLIIIALQLVVILPITGGYIANVYKLFKSDFQAPYKAEILRGVGIVVPPVGIVTGYLNLE